LREAATDLDKGGAPVNQSSSSPSPQRGTGTKLDKALDLQKVEKLEDAVELCKLYGES